MSRNVAVKTIPASVSFSEFIQRPEPGYFKIRRVPVAPDAEVKRGYDLEKREYWEEVTIFHACPHCHEDIKFRYDTETASESSVDAMKRTVDEACYEAAKARLEAKTAIDRAEYSQRIDLTADLHLAALEEWYES